MSDGTKIEWTDATWNPVRGCTKISPGCSHCYAETFAERFRGVKGHPYEQGFDLRLVPEKLRDPFLWTTRKRVFVNSMSDLFHVDVPDEYIVRVARVMALADWHTYQVLTKRSERMAEMLRTTLRFAAELPHIWWGVSVENKKHGLPRIDHLRAAPASIRFLSVEPLLEDLSEVNLTGIHWMIVGGESGPGARPMHPDWIRSLRDQCRAANVAFFFKQWGGVQKSKTGRRLDKRTYDEQPEEVQQNEMPSRRVRLQLVEQPQPRQQSTLNGASLMSQKKDYAGREQSLVKHYILRNYLERFAHIIGSWASTITFVDCFSGPWESKSPDLSDTSFAIALAELRKARDTLAKRKRSLSIRCFFLEENPRAHARLEQFAQQQADVIAETRNATMLDSIPQILDFVQRGRKSFPFFFIDPTGWSGFDLDRIKPLLRQNPGEVLINFMTEHIRRFVTPKEKRAEIIDSFRRLFGTEDVFERVSQIADAQDREDELFTAYADRVREVGGFTYTCPAVVLHPVGERTYFHLIYATRHRKGVAVFKEVEKAAYPVQERLRAAAEERVAIKKTKQPTLFAEVEQPPSARAAMLRQRYLTAARSRVEELRGKRKQVPFDDIWDAAMAFPLVWDSDVKGWISAWKKDGRVKIPTLKGKQRVPQVEEGHVIEFLK